MNEFDKDYFNGLINSKQYIQAADYAAQHMPNDKNKIATYEADIANLRNLGRKQEAIFGRIDDNDKQAVEFAEAIYNNGGLETLEDNSYAKAFIDAKRKLGSDIDDKGNIKSEAMFLDVKFPKKIQKLFGLDDLMPDSDNSFEDFCINNGLNENDLQKAGVSINRNSDGSSTLHFHKSSPLANKIISSINTYQLKDQPASGYGIITSGDRWYNVLKNLGINAVIPGSVGVAGLYNNYRNEISITGYDENNNKLSNFDNTKEIRQLTNKALRKKNKAYEALPLNPVYNAIEGPILNSNLLTIDERWKAGGFKDYSEYEAARAKAIGAIDNQMASLNSNIVFYANAYNKNENDKTITGLDNTQRTELSDYIRYILQHNKQKANYYSYMGGNDIGILMRIAANDDNDKVPSRFKDFAKRDISIFIPDADVANVVNKLNMNTSTRAQKEVNDLQAYNYNYETGTGLTIASDYRGGFVISDKNGNSRLVDRATAAKEINRDFLIDFSNRLLLKQFTNVNGGITDDNAYVTAAKLMAIKAGKDLNPQTALVDAYGNSFKIDDIFNRVWDKEENKQKLTPDQNIAIQDILDIYERLLSNLAE